MEETITLMKELMTAMSENLDKTLEGNKSAAKRARKQTLRLAALGKTFRRLSIDNAKSNK